MPTTRRSNVFDQMLSMARAMDQAYGRDESFPTNWNETQRAQLWFPPLDAYETTDAYLVELDLPGVHPENVDISFEQNTLTIKGTRAPTLRAPEKGELRVYTAERVSGTFARDIRLPEYVDGEKIEATFNNGVLSITVPKAPSALPKKITIKGEATEARRLNA